MSSCYPCMDSTAEVGMAWGAFFATWGLPSVTEQVLRWGVRAPAFCSSLRSPSPAPCTRWQGAGWCTPSIPTAGRLRRPSHRGLAPSPGGQAPPFEKIWQVVLHFQRNRNSSSVAQLPSNLACIVRSDAFAVSFGMFRRGISMPHKWECVAKYISSYSLADGVMQGNASLPSTFKWTWQARPNACEVLLTSDHISPWVEIMRSTQSPWPLI